MNDRIAELKSQCIVREQRGTNAFDSYMVDRFDTEKFAELIVRECVERVAGSVVRDKGHIPQDPHSQGWNDAVAYAGKELKKYFGVE
jgi:hypothetical protein